MAQDAYSGLTNDPSNFWLQDYLRRMASDYSGGWGGSGGGGGFNTVNWRDYTYGNAGQDLGNYYPGGNDRGFDWLNQIPWGNIAGGIYRGIRGGAGSNQGGVGGASTGTWNPGVANPSGGTPKPTSGGQDIPTGAGTGIPQGTPGTASSASGAAPWIKSAAGLGSSLLPLLLSGGGGSTGGTQFSGDLSNQLQQLLSSYLPSASSYMQNAGNINPYQGQANQLWQMLGSNVPSDYGQQIWNNLQGTNTISSGVGAQGNQAVQGIQNLWNQIYQQGLPNQTAIEQIAPGALSSANSLSSGYNPFSDPNYTWDPSQGYGTQQLLQQVMAKGLPGQRGIENLSTSLANQAATGGLTPDIINAYKSLLLQPQQEALQGQLNRQGGGVAAVPQIDQYGNMTSADSGALGELMRRNEQAFNNQLLTQGFQNQQGLANAATGAFGQVASSAYPYINLANTAGQQGIQNALQTFGAVPNAVYPFAALSGNLGAGSQQLGLQGLLSGTQQMGTAGNQGINNLLALLQNQQGYQLGQQGQQGDLARTLLSGLFGNQANEAQMSAATKQMLGQIVQGGISSLPAIIKLIQGWGNSSGSSAPTIPNYPEVPIYWPGG